MQALHSVEHAAQWLRQHVTGSLHVDSRKIVAGDGFVAWPGAKVDARQFVAGALERGAAACLVEQAGVEPFGLASERVGSVPGLKTRIGAIAAEYFGNPSRQLPVIAVTGTNGKTSSAWWLAQALSALPSPHTLPCAVIGTLGVGHPPPLLPGATPGKNVVATGLTTPDPVLLQHTLRQFVDEGTRACAMEASSIGIEEGRMEGVEIQVAVFCNFTQDHLDYHGSMEAYWQAKRRLFSWPGLRSVVINVDDSKGAELASALHASALDVWTVSAQNSARLQARGVTYDGQGLCCEVLEGDVALVLRTRLIGTFNISNVLGVLGAMRSLGVPLEAAVQACSALRPVPGRMECLGGDARPLVAVDYAHTPDALGQALAALRPLARQRGGRLWCVFGCGGDRDASKRPLMGAIAAQGADQVVVTSDNPRSEKPEAIIAQILLGVAHSGTVNVQAERALAIAETLQMADARDVILLAGKGHEEMQEIAGVKYPFSDRAHAEAALGARAVSQTKESA